VTSWNYSDENWAICRGRNKIEDDVKKSEATDIFSNVENIGKPIRLNFKDDLLG
jgi:hypothetical protein